MNVRLNESVDLKSLDLSENAFPTSSGGSVSLDNARVYNCSGYKPNSGFLPKEWLDEDGFVLCDNTQRVRAVPSGRVFACGDICDSTHFVNGERMEHFACSHALAILHSIPRLVAAGPLQNGVAPSVPLFSYTPHSSSCLPAAAISLGKENMVAFFDNEAFLPFGLYYEAEVERLRATGKPITEGWLGKGPAPVKFFFCGLLKGWLTDGGDEMLEAVNGAEVVDDKTGENLAPPPPPAAAEGREEAEAENTQAGTEVPPVQ